MYILRTYIATITTSRVFIDYSCYTMVLNNNLLHQQYLHQHLLLLISLQLRNYFPLILPPEEVFCLSVKCST